MRAHRLDTVSQNRYTYTTLFKMHKVSDVFLTASLVGPYGRNFLERGDPHLHIGSGEHDETEDVAKNPDGNDDESHIVGNKMYLLQRQGLLVLIAHGVLIPQLSLNIQNVK